MSKKAKSKKVNNVETVQTVDVNALLEELASLKSQLTEKDETIQQLTLQKNASKSGISHHNKTNFLQYVSLFQSMEIVEINGEKYGLVKNVDMRKHGFKLSQYTTYFKTDMFSKSYQFKSLSYWIGAFNLKVCHTAVIDGVECAYLQVCTSEHYLNIITDKVNSGSKTWTQKDLDRASEIVNTIASDDDLTVETPFGLQCIDMDQWFKLFTDYIEKHDLITKCSEKIKLHD